MIVRMRGRRNVNRRLVGNAILTIVCSCSNINPFVPVCVFVFLFFFFFTFYLPFLDTIPSSKHSIPIIDSARVNTIVLRHTALFLLLIV